MGTQGYTEICTVSTISISVRGQSSPTLLSLNGRLARDGSHSASCCLLSAVSSGTPGCDERDRLLRRQPSLILSAHRNRARRSSREIGYRFPRFERATLSYVSWSSSSPRIHRFWPGSRPRGSSRILQS